MNPADQYFERATQYYLVADRESDPDRRELMRELALCWLLQAEKADEYWARNIGSRRSYKDWPKLGGLDDKAAKALAKTRPAQAPRKPRRESGRESGPE